MSLVEYKSLQNKQVSTAANAAEAIEPLFLVSKKKTNVFSSLELNELHVKHTNKVNHIFFLIKAFMNRIIRQ